MHLSSFILCRYNISEFVYNGKIVATPDNGQKIESRPSIQKINGELFSCFQNDNTIKHPYVSLNALPFV